jgi:hypothetical protein
MWEEVWSEQSRTINAAVMNLGKEIRLHLKTAKREGRSVPAARTKCVALVRRMLARVGTYSPP